MIKVGLLALFGIWLGFGSYWTFGTYSRVDYNNDLRNGGEKLICSSALSRARLGDKKVDQILASVPSDGQFNCIKTWRLSDSLGYQSNYCPQFLYLFSFSTIIFVSIFWNFSTTSIFDLCFFFYNSGMVDFHCQCYLFESGIILIRKWQNRRLQGPNRRTASYSNKCLWS